MRIKTKLNGITTTSTYEEGDCYSLVNLRKKNGTLHPVTPRKVEYMLKETYNIVFIHQFNDYENWIGIKTDIIGSSIWNDINRVPIRLFDTKEKIIGVQQIGNTLSLITEETILYMLYVNGTYKFLGEIPEIEPIKWFNYGYYNTLTEYERFEDIGLYTQMIDSERYFDDAKGMFAELRKDMYDKHDGCLFDAHLLVFAFKMYDGTYIKQTSPVLLLGNLFENVNATFESVLHPASGWGFWVDPPYMGFMRMVGINANKIYLEFDLSYLEGWEDIISSIDVFISPGLGNNSESNFVDSLEQYAHEWDHGKMVYNLMKDNFNMIQNIKTAGNFYRVDSILLGTKSIYTDGSQINLKSMFCFPKKELLSDINSLLQKEELSIDSFSHHTITGNVSYSYNNRLHLAVVKTRLFSGFGINFFTLPDRFLGESYFGINYTHELDKDNGSGSEKPVTDLRYNGIKRSQLDLYNIPNGILIVVYIKTNSGDMPVYSLYESGLTFWVNPFYSYPDSRAKTVRFYKIISANEFVLIHETNLIQSVVNNFSYSIFYDIKTINNSDLYQVKPVIPNKWENQTIESFVVPEQTPGYIESNKLKVSELNNPFFFPNAQTYLVSNGRILNMASVAIRISEGQFGQFPLYVFTTKGIYSMQVGSGEVVYATESAPTSHEVPIETTGNNPTSPVCITPFGILFVSSRGLCIISGQNVELLTAQLREKPKELFLQSNPELYEKLMKYMDNSFTEYAKKIEYILYNPTENEIIIVDRDSEFNFVMNFDSKQYYLSTDKIDLVVENTFPKLMVTDGLNVKNYAHSESDDAFVSMVTRPLNFGTTDLKRFERMFLRSILYDPKEAVILNYFSLDEVNFRVLKGFRIDPQTRKDFDLGMYSRSKYRQFIFAFSGILNEKSEIEYLETEIDKEFNNTKMR